MTMNRKSKKKLRPENINHDEQGMIQGVKRLAELTVRDIMVPRIDAVFVSLDKPTPGTLSEIIKSGHSRFPIYRDVIDNVVGVLYVKDILLHYPHFDIAQFNIEHVMRKPYFVPGSKRIDSLLREMKARRVHIAVVVDEYGGVSGIVSLEDVIEEIVGEIRDEFDTEQDAIIRVREHTYLCDARVPIVELNSKCNLELPHDNFDTLGGFVFDLFGKIPMRYERQSFSGFDFIIQEMRGNRIESIKVVLQNAKKS